MLSEEQRTKRLDACNKRLAKARTTLTDLKRHMDAFDREFDALTEQARVAGIIRPGETPGTLEREDDERRECENVRPVSQD